MLGLVSGVPKYICLLIPVHLLPNACTFFNVINTLTRMLHGFFALGRVFFKHVGLMHVGPGLKLREMPPTHRFVTTRLTANGNQRCLCLAADREVAMFGISQFYQWQDELWVKESTLLLKCVGETRLSFNSTKQISVPKNC